MNKLTLQRTKKYKKKTKKKKKEKEKERGKYSIWGPAARSITNTKPKQTKIAYTQAQTKAPLHSTSRCRPRRCAVAVAGAFNSQCVVTSKNVNVRQDENAQTGPYLFGRGAFFIVFDGILNFRLRFVRSLSRIMPYRRRYIDYLANKFPRADVNDVDDDDDDDDDHKKK